MGAVRAALEERSFLRSRSAVSLSSAAFKERPEQNCATVHITQASPLFRKKSCSHDCFCGTFLGFVRVFFLASLALASPSFELLARLEYDFPFTSLVKSSSFPSTASIKRLGLASAGGDREDLLLEMLTGLLHAPLRVRYPTAMQMVSHVDRRLLSFPGMESSGGGG